MAIANLIKVDNGYFETINEFRAPSPIGFNVEVFIWEGDILTDKPTDPTLSIYVSAEVNPIIGSADGYFNLGRYVQPYIDFLPKNSNYQKGVWVQYQYTRAGFESDTPVDSDVLFALLGSNKYEVGNTSPVPQTEFNGVVMGCNSNELTCHPDSDLIVPVYVGSDSTNAKIVTATQSIPLTSLGAVLNSNSSLQQIFYIPLNATTFGSEWQEGKTIKYYITDSNGQAIIEGISFNGTNTYMDLGIVPLINSSNSYVKIDMKAYSWDANNTPYGCRTSGDNAFYYTRTSTELKFRFQREIEVVQADNYPNTDEYQENYIKPSTWSSSDPALRKTWIMVGGTDGLGGDVIATDMELATYSLSGCNFYLGALNNNGTAINFTETIFTEAEFFNGSETKTFNASNNWRGATNYGGTYVYSIDGGLTWNAEGDHNQYCLRLKCFKGGATSLRYYNCDGVLIDIPINGRVTESANYKRKTFSNFQLSNSGGWDQAIHSNKPYQSNGRKIYTVHTGWVKETVNNMIKDLLLSKAVWLVYEGQETPIVIKDTQKKFINRLWEKEIGYTINLEASNEILL